MENHSAQPCHFGRATAHRKSILLGATSFCLLISAPAAAQTTLAPANPVVVPASPDAATTTPTEGMADIVVTAEKRATPVMRTNIAVTALSGKDLAAREVRNAIDLQTFVPSLSVTNNGLTNNVNIRGIGLNITSPSVVSGVAIYRDNLFQAPIVAGEPYYDVANIQVLRGPQGTFVGTNSTGGALFVTSTDPQFDEGTHGYVTAKGGSYSDRGLEAAINQPISDTLAARVAFYDEQRSSFYQNQSANPASSFKNLTHPGNMSIVAGRIGLLWKPTSNLQILTKAEYYQNRTGGFALKPIPGSALAPFAPADPFKLAYSIPFPRYDESLWRVDSEIKYTLPNDITIRSVSGITKYNYQLVTDTGASSQLSSIQSNQAREYVVSQELNIISPDAGRLHWVAGFYYNYDHADVQAGIQNYGGFGPATSPTNNIFVHLQNAKQTLAGFAGLRFKLTDNLELQGSGRYTWSRVHNDPSSILNVFLTSGPGTPANPLMVVNQPQTGAEKDDGATWKAAINWTANSHNYLYAFVATGRKAGGIQDALHNFQPERVTDYEAGWKSTMLGGRLRTQIGGFYNTYTDLQVVSIIPSTGRSSVFNSGSAKIYGAEGEATLALGRLQIDAVASYVHSQVQISNIVNSSALPDGGAGTLGLQCAPGQTAGCFDYAPYVGSVTGSLPYAPRYTATLGASYGFDIGNRGKLTPRFDVSRTGVQYTSIFHSTFARLRDRTVFNLKLAYELAPFTVEAYVTNVTNQTYPVGRTGNAWFYGAPRQFGGKVSFRF